MNVVRQRVISDMVHCIIYSIVKGNDAFPVGGSNILFAKRLFLPSYKHIG